jgi:beta-lactamase class A
MLLRAAKNLGILALALAAVGWFIHKNTPRERAQEPLLITPLSSLSPKAKSSAETFLPTPRSTAGVITQLLETMKGYTGDYGVYVQSLVDGTTYGVRSDQPYPAASLLKLPIMQAAFTAAENGTLKLDDLYTVNAADQIAWTTLATVPVGSQWSYRQLLQFMGNSSDSSAAQVMIRKLGMPAVLTAMDAAGMQHTDFDQDNTTPEDIGVFFSHLAAGKLLSPEDKNELLTDITDTAFEDRIPAGLPPGTAISHKIGTEDGTYSDAGIIFGKNPFVLVVMSNNADYTEAPAVIAKLTRVAWDFEEK